MGALVEFHSVMLGLRHPKVNEPEFVPFAFAFEYDKLTVGARIVDASSLLGLTGYPAAELESVFEELFEHIGRQPGQRVALAQALDEVVGPTGVATVFDERQGELEEDMAFLSLIGGMSELREIFVEALAALGQSHLETHVEIKYRKVDGQIMKCTVKEFLGVLAGAA